MPGSARPGPPGSTAVDVEVRRIVNLPQVMAEHYREFHPAEYAAAVKPAVDEAVGASEFLIDGLQEAYDWVTEPACATNPDVRVYRTSL